MMLKASGKNLRGMNTTPHIAPRQHSRTIDGQTMRHKTYQVSQRKRKRVEKIFGWAKTLGMIRKAKMRGREKID